MEKIKKYVSKENIWYLVIWGALGIFILTGIFCKNLSMLNFFHSNPNDTWMDFFNSMMYKHSPYELKVIYPPLINLFYYIVHFFIADEAFAQGSLAVRASQSGRIVISLYFIISTVLLTYGIMKLKKGDLNKKIFFVLTMILTYPFLYLMERGNSAILCLIFLMFFIYGYKSDKKYIRHLAYISLAIAASIKIYPALFGLLIIRDKDWKGAMWAIIYGVIIFFVPFVFFGGFKNIGLFIQNILNCIDMMADQGAGFKVSIGNAFRILEQYLGTKNSLEIVATIFKLIILVGGSILIIFGKYKEKWKLFMVPTMIMVLIPDFSFIYSMVYFIIPLIYFLDEKSKIENRKEKILNIIYFVLFAGMFITIPNLLPEWFEIFENDHYPLTLPTLIDNIVVVIFMCILWVDISYFSIKKYIREKKASKSLSK